MLLSDRTLRQLIETHVIGLSPFDPSRLGPASYDLTLARDLLFPEHTYKVDPYDEHNVKWIPYTPYEESGKFDLRSGQLALASTVERITLPSGYAGRIEGKSSLGRLGLNVHVTAGFIDPGFDGQITLELVNSASWSMVLTVGMPIAQLCVWRLDRPAETPYNGNYQGQTGATASRYHTNDRPNDFLDRLLRTGQR